jgi:hypothetical protein
VAREISSCDNFFHFFSDAFKNSNSFSSGCLLHKMILVLNSCRAFYLKRATEFEQGQSSDPDRAICSKYISTTRKKGAAGKRGPLNLKIEHNSANTDQIFEHRYENIIKFQENMQIYFSKNIFFLTKNWHLLKIPFFFSIIEFPSETDTIRSK